MHAAVIIRAKLRWIISYFYYSWRTPNQELPYGNANNWFVYEFVFNRIHQSQLVIQEVVDLSHNQICHQEAVATVATQTLQVGWGTEAELKVAYAYIIDHNTL